MVEIISAFLAIAAIIFIGYFGLVFFKKTNISEILILMLIGLIIGPLLGFVGAEEVKTLTDFLPFFASFALMVVTFEGGMQLNFFKTIKSLPSAFVFTFLVFIFTLGFVGATWYFVTGNLLVGLLLGAIIAGTSAEVIIPLVSQTSAKDETKTLLGLESALNDSLCIVIALALAGMILISSNGGTSQITIASLGGSILSSFSIAAVLGFIGGIVWLKALEYFERKPYEYLVTLAVLMFLYSITEFFGGNGAISALVFGLVLGNSEDVTNMLRFVPRKLEGTIKSFQMEVSFLVKTFFFVYIGILFNLAYLQKIEVVGVALTIIVIILITRFIAARIMQFFEPVLKNDTLLLVSMNSRGLATATLVSFPAIAVLGLPQMNEMTAIVFLIIFASNIMTTIGVFLFERKTKKVITA
jgi:cell volume regulation protein A